MLTQLPLFSIPDSPDMGQSLREMLTAIPTYPIVGLIVKVERDPEGRERIVNWTFADADLVKLLAFVLLKP